MAKYHHGLVPLSADPITFGHVDIVERSAKLCDSVTVYVSHNDAKLGKYTFSLEERVEFTRRALAHLKGNVRVVGGGALLVDTFLVHGCDVLIRGIRNEADERYEDEQMSYHALVYPEIADKIVYLRARSGYVRVSSSLVKTFVSHNIDVSRFVPMYVKAALEERIAGRYMVGVTGEMASGKSTIARHMVRGLLKAGTPAIHIDVDALSRSVLFEESAGGDVLRAALTEVLSCDDLFDGTQSAVLVRFRATFFREGISDDTRARVHALVRPHVERLYRTSIAGFRGVVIYEWAQLAEMGMLGLVNNVVVVVESPDRKSLAKARGVSDEHYHFVGKVQGSADTKARIVQECIDQDGYGHVVRIQNTIDTDSAVLADTVLVALTLVGKGTPSEPFHAAKGGGGQTKPLM